MTEARGEVFDIGYQRYAGVREGRWRSRTALWMNGIRTALGLGRGWPSKILPIILALFLITVAIVFILLGTLLDAVTDDIPGAEDYYQGVLIILLLFSAIIAPELLTSDRRNGVINLYLVRPLTTTDYVAARWLAFFSVTLILVWLPQVILFVGLTLGAGDTLDYLKDNWKDVPRFITAGLAIAIFTTTLPLAAAAFTTRRAYAAAFVIGLWVVAIATGNALVESIDSDNAKWFALIDIGSVPIFINDMIFDRDSGDELFRAARRIPDGIIIAWYLVLTIGPATALWWRYKRIKV